MVTKKQKEDFLKNILKNYSDSDSTQSDNTLNEQIKQFKSQLNTLETEMDKTRNSIIQITAIFVALFTFISVEIKFFSVPFGPFVLVGLSLILIGALLFFLFFLDKIINGSESYSFILSSIIIIFLGALAVNLGFLQSNKYIFIDGTDKGKYILIDQDQKDSYTKNIENQINQANSTANSSLNEFKTCLHDNGYLAKECFK